MRPERPKWKAAGSRCVGMSQKNPEMSDGNPWTDRLKEGLTQKRAAGEENIQETYT
jgi:hypothetical protein